MFTEWAGISPKKFLQYLTVEYAKGILTEKKASLFDTAFETAFPVPAACTTCLLR